LAERQSVDFQRLSSQLDAIRAGIREVGVDGWLLYDLHARNTVASKLLGHGDMTRRYFVYVPAEGEPRALIHGIEEAPWDGWSWERASYVGWRELDDRLRTLLSGVGRVAMETSDGDAVPAVDLVPAGVIELVRSTGVEVVSSGDLISRFHSRWSDEELGTHRRASKILADTAREILERLAASVDDGVFVTEGTVSEWVVDALNGSGLRAGADCIVATGVNAADPHYAPLSGGAAFRRADAVLLDLWAKEREEAIYADQTWMGYLGASVPERHAKLFGIICAARDAAVEFLEQSWKAGQTVQGSEVDDVARNLITDEGYGAFFIHRTGHSIDQATHGMGPNIDNLETRDVRRLIPGVGFSIEPGIYIPGEVGVRTEINVFMGESGPEVTTPEPQSEMWTLLAK
jgi:Xaa-Pro aminopeptidase